MNYLLALALMLGMTLAGCKKDKTTSDTTLAGGDVALSQDAESQDAVADNVDQTVDDKLTSIEQNGFDISNQKSAMVGGGSWTCTHAGDTAAWPKVITITFGDTAVNGENLHYTGSIVITDSLIPGAGTWRNRLIRKIKFAGFGIVSDSSSVIVTGTRTVTRTSVKYTPALSTVTANTTSLRLEVTDAITANLTFTITCGDFTKSFTRVVDRTRKAIAHFEKGTIFWRQAYLKDTVTINGTVSGKNLQDSTYSRVITAPPITITRCPLLFPIISAGKMTLTNGSKTATLDYSSDGCKTKVTITKGDKTKVIERKINRKFHNWWAK
jgi:hypothetical protein